MVLNLKEFKRFEKQIILKKIGISGQKKIKKAKVLIIGIGGLGCPLLTYLVSSGINNIGIVDHDKIELGNLNRQILFNTSDLGKYKVNQAKVKIKKIYNQIKLKTHKIKITKKNIDIIASLSKEFPDKKFMGFCAETEKIEEHAKVKLVEKGLDFIVANDVSKKKIGFNSDFNKVSMIDQKGNIKILPKNKKSFIANKIAQILLDKLIDDRNIN